ncbi:glycosyltransferase [Methylophilus luteus]|uniref:Glycosyltransferase n=1 Tax=Methylophilus luteus TaxID=640108 RepID=A0ABW3F6Q2_9PROT
MIFVTVGTQLPFDRLVKTVDTWNAAKLVELYLQVGPSEYKPQNAEFSVFLEPAKADQLFQQAEIIISHAGMGSILTALRYQKPIIIMPRLAAQGEHRNDHQLATCKWLGNKSGIHVAQNEMELLAILSDYQSLKGGDGISNFASPELIDNLKTFFSA